MSAAREPAGFRIASHRTAPRHVTRAGTDAIEAIFQFETAEGRGSGVLRLTPDADDGNTLKAWTLLTALDEIKGLEERVGRSRPQGKSYSRDFRGPNWLDLQESRRRLCRPRSGRAGRRRRAGRTFDRRAPHPIAGRYADRRPRAAHRRQLAQPLSRADPAQPGARQSPSLHAVSAELADLHSQGQACRLVRGLCGKHGAQLLDRHRIRGRHVRRTDRSDGPSCCAGRTARSGRCTRATSSWRPASAAFRTFRIFRRCATSAARFCTPANTTTARRGGARTRSSSAPATAATTSRRTCTRAAQRSRSCSAARP